MSQAIGELSVYSSLLYYSLHVCCLR